MTKKKIQLLRKLINGHNDFSFEEKIIADNILINFTVSQLQIILYFLESKKRKILLMIHIMILTRWKELIEKKSKP